MTNNEDSFAKLKQRALAGDCEAVAQLRASGFFNRPKGPKQYPASSEQQRIWLIDRLQTDGHLYNVPSAVLLEGDVDPQAFKQAFTLLQQRHETLRSSLVEEDGGICQLVGSRTVPLDFLDLGSVEDPFAEARSLIERDASFVFDLTEAPLLRARLMRLNSHQYVFSCVLHHAMCDEWSLNVVLEDTLALHEQLQRGQAPQLPSLRMQYGDYAVSQKEDLASPARVADRDYWMSQFAEGVPLLDLAADMPRKPESPRLGENISFSIDPETSRELERLRRASHTTPFQTLTAITLALLHRYTGTSDLVIGTAMTGRDHPDLERLVGVFVNTLAIRFRVEAEWPFERLMTEVKANTENAYLHGMYPFDALVSDLKIAPLPGRSPLFDVGLYFQEPYLPQRRIASLLVSPFEFSYGAAKLDLSFYFSVDDDAMRLVLNYNTALFRPETIARMGFHLTTLARELVGHPQGRIDGREIVTSEELQLQLGTHRDEAEAQTRAQSIVDLFERQARAYPGVEAVVCGQQILTYFMLNGRANGVANCLLGMLSPSAPQAMIAVLLNPSEHVVSVFLGILKAGAAYVPLDPSLPIERLGFLLEDCGAQVVITEEALAAKLLPVLLGREMKVLQLSQIAEEITNPARSIAPTDVAYMIYTSGSTGEPKGCCVEHRNVVSLLLNAQPLFGFREDDTWIVAHSFAFDFSVWEMYGALLFGGKLVIPSREEIRDPDSFHEIVRKHRISILNQTPAAFLNFMRSEATAPVHDLHHHLRCVIFGGDRLEPTHLRDWVRWYSLDVVRLVNMFGITETTVHVTYGPLQLRHIMEAPGRSPVGKPLPGTRVYVLNEAKKLQPIGVPGEIFVGGTGVSRGYWRRPALTAARFLDDPFHPGERVYRSGDMGRYLADGTLEHLGRNDSQVQVRGYRVELHEVERALLAHAAIERAIVTSRTTPDGVQELVAYYIAGSSAFGPAELMEFLSRKLPEYMIPSRFFLVESFPLTANNKIDIEALAALAPESQKPSVAAEPLDRYQMALLRIWQKTLGVSSISIHDSYAGLGGDSMKIIRLVSSIAAELGVRVTPRDIYTHTTIASLSRFLHESAVLGEDTAEQDLRLLEEKRNGILNDSRQLASLPPDWEDVYPASEIEVGMLFHGLQDEASGVYHDQFVYELKDETFSIELFVQTLEALCARHSILRTSYLLTSNPVHVVHARCRSRVTLEDLSPLPVSEQKKRLDELLVDDRRRPFDPAEPGLWRCLLLKRSASAYAIVWSFHHAILDGWSNAALITELMETYFRRKHKPSYALAPLRSSYRDFVASQLVVEADQQTRLFWAKELDDCESTPLPLGRERRAAGERLKATFRLDTQLGERLLQLARSERVGVKEVYLAAFLSWLNRVTGADDLVFGLVSHSRPAIEDGERILGCFLNSVPFRFRKAAEMTPRQLLRLTGQTLHRLHGFSRLSTRRIGQAAGRDPHAGAVALFNVLFNFIDFHVLKALEETGIASARTLESFESTNTPFDVSVSGTFGEFSFSFYYFAETYRADEIERLGQYYLRSLEAFASAPDKSIDGSLILDPKEMDRLLVEFNPAPAPYPNGSIQQEFDRQVAKFADRLSVASEQHELTYAQLDCWANGLARWLLNEGKTQPEERVALLLERSAALPAAMLGVLKAGCSYVPLDPEFPPARIEHILRECGCRFILVQQNALNSQIAGVVHVDIDRFQHETVSSPATSVGAESLAYIMYTSGSTGRPKGVMVEHRSVLRLVCGTNYVSLGPADRILQGGSIAFDACTFEIWGALLNGGCVIIPRAGVLADPQEFANMLLREAPSVLFLTTALFKGFADFDPDMFRSVRTLLSGGEKVSVPHFQRIAAACPGTELLHVYGPTENTTFSAFHRFRPDDVYDVPIGTPISNSTAYILDARQQLLPLGVPGEICVGGDGLARGYLSDPDRTASSFVQAKFPGGKRLYRTGDVGRWSEEGTLEFIGRMDSQVKVNGFRIEPTEIEAAMRNCPGLIDAAVIARRDAAGSTALSGFFTAAACLTEADLNAHLRTVLPKWAVPARLLRLGSIPMSRTGKIDRAALLTLETGPADDRRRIEPLLGEREEALAAVWRDVFGIERVAPTDDYFACGGDSIKALQVSARLRFAGWRLAVRDLFEHTTIRELAPRLERIQTIRGTKRRGNGTLPFTPIQRWFVENHPGPLDHFNMSLILIARERVDASALQAALNAIAAIHDAFRARFPADGTQQFAECMAEIPLDVEDLRGEIEAAGAINDRSRQLQTRLSLQNGPVARAALYRLPEDDRVVIAVHHMVFDGISWRILLDDLEQAYAAQLEDKVPHLSLPEASFSEWVDYLLSKASSPSLLAEIPYWEEVLGSSSISFPVDNRDGGNTYGQAQSVSFALDPSLSAQIHSGSDDRVAQTVLLTALARAIDRAYNSKNTLLLLEGHGRLEDGELNVSSTVGWFTALYPFRLQLAGYTPALQRRTVHEAVLSVPRKGTGFGVLRYLAEETVRERLSGYPLPRISFNYLGELVPAAAHRRFTLLDTVEGIIDPRLQRQTELDITSAFFERALHVSLVFGRDRCSPSTMENFARILREEIENTLGPDEDLTSYTRFDGVSAEDFAVILRKVQ